MSERNPYDYYPTPHWCVHRLLETVTLPPGVWVEPAAGDGAIITAVRKAGVRVTFWHAIELREENKPKLKKALATKGALDCPTDFLSLNSHDFPVTPTVIITNPPFSLALEFILHSLSLCPKYVVMLLKLNFLASAKRHPLYSTKMPDVYVLPNRPSFTGRGTDSAEYAWCIWDGTQNKTGNIEVLNLTPKDERR